MLIGDCNQIPYINRTKNIEVKYHNVTEITKTTKTLNTTYRCTKSTTAIISKYYEQGIKTTNKIEKELEIRQYNGLEDIYESLHHCIVVVSRHTNSFLYITSNSNDKLGQWIKQINLLSQHELLESYIKSETPNTQSNRGAADSTSHTSFIRTKITTKRKTQEITHIHTPPPQKLKNQSRTKNDPKTTKHTLRSFTKTSIGCRKKSCQGGVAGYVRKSAEKQVLLLCTSGEESEMTCKTALFELKFNKKLLLVLGVYRPPSTNLDTATAIISEQLQRALAADRQIVIMGDINVDNLAADNTENSAQDTNEAYNNFNTTLQSILNFTCPLKITRPKQQRKPQIWDQESTRLRSIYVKDLGKEQLTGQPEDKATTAASKKEYDQHFKQLRKEHSTAYINRAENKSRALWQTINRERESKPNKENHINLQLDNKIIDDPTKVSCPHML
ncbi:hypothetical protein J6590_022997 [Homalodisca vitripennis]|nr:hypothetical protein J6590_022997 [Homalodisca vitripennis]